MASIEIEGVSKVFPGDVRAVDGVSLAIDDGEFVVLVGPSGSGKSTVLRMIAGLEEATEGRIAIGGRVVNDLPPKSRDIAMVFQDYALYPQMTAFETMEFALRIQRVPKPERRSRVTAAARMLGIGDLLERRPLQLSGGQRQRVAMGRAVVREPRAFLMDEPLSNLDAKLRGQMRAEIGRLHHRLHTTTVLVTHDQIEAMTMAQRIAVMRDGRVEQVDAPQRIYEAPANVFVAGFIGSPPMNMVRASLSSKDGAVIARFGRYSIRVQDEVLARCRELHAVDGREVVLGIRPEAIDDADATSSEEGRLELDVALVEPMGAEVVVHLDVDLPPGALEGLHEIHEDGDASAGPAETGGTMFTARLGPRTGAKAGERITVSVDGSRVYLFDPGSGLAL